MAGVRKTHNGIAYFSVGGAATFLGTNTAKIKQLMGDGTLDWCNLRNNGPIFVRKSYQTQAPTCRRQVRYHSTKNLR